LDAREIALLKKIRIETGRKIDTLYAGEYRSAFRGQGLSFEAVREYMAGDDVRSIDWNVSARMNHLFVKEYSQERELSVLLMVDLSGSTDFGSSASKRAAILEFTAMMLYLAQMNNDRVSLILFTNRVEKFLRPRKGRKFVLRVLDEVIKLKPLGRGTNIRNAADFAAKVLKKRSIIFLISDFMDASGDYMSRLNHMSGKHDIICVHVSDPFEKRFPFSGLVECRDLETGKVFLSDAVPRDGAVQVTGSFDTIRLSTDKPVEVPLLRFFDERKMKVRYR
jgi:uncharacterized protein (DUF58 family)